MSKYSYILVNTGSSSSKYGKCEVCGEHVSEVFHQIEKVGYIRPDGDIGYTDYGCHHYFGHESCLINKRR